MDKSIIALIFMKFSYLWQKRHYFFLILLALGFFLATSLYNLATQESGYVKFLSPDETANYFFARQYAETGKISTFEPANLIAEEVVHPRSIRSDHGILKPVSFLGIILVYGKIGALAGTTVIPYITPLLAAIGLLFFYGFVRRLFGRKTALYSAALLACFPVYFFYTTRSMFHNILFIFFLLGASYFFLRAIPLKSEEKRPFISFKITGKQAVTWFFSVAAGLFVGGAIGARASELLWLAPTLFIAWVSFAKRIGITRLVLMVAGMIIALLPVFYWNQILYSSPFYGGYGEMNRSISELSQAGGSLIQSTVHGNFSQYRAVGQALIDNIFYFGYQPYQSLRMFYYYVVAMFPLFCGLVFIGGVIFLIRLRRRSLRPALVYLSCWLTLSLILVFYYGSWKFNDNPDPSRFTIGNSYTRYWLPMYIMAIPFAALALESVGRWLGTLIPKEPALLWKERSRKMIMVSVSAMATASVCFLFLMYTVFGSEEGLANLYYNHFIDKENAEAILSRTPDNAIIMTQYHDKQLFPERKVINALLTNEQINISVGRILEHYPIYYFNFAFPEKDYLYLKERRLPTYGFTFELLERRGRFGLYELKPAEAGQVSYER
ncbi:MAG: DUF6541 family protein [Bacillota bacterium]